MKIQAGIVDYTDNGVAISLTITNSSNDGPPVFALSSRKSMLDVVIDFDEESLRDLKHVVDTALTEIVRRVHKKSVKKVSDKGVPCAC